MLIIPGIMLPEDMLLLLVEFGIIIFAGGRVWLFMLEMRKCRKDWTGISLLCSREMEWDVSAGLEEKDT